MLGLDWSKIASVSDVRYVRVSFVKKRRGFYHVFSSWPAAEGVHIGSVLKVKDATANASWIFIPVKRFRLLAEKPYERFCFGTNRRLAVSNFIKGKHTTFQTGSSPPWIKSTISCC